MRRSSFDCLPESFGCLPRSLPLARAHAHEVRLELGKRRQNVEEHLPHGIGRRVATLAERQRHTARDQGIRYDARRERIGQADRASVPPACHRRGQRRAPGRAPALRRFVPVRPWSV